MQRRSVCAEVKPSPCKNVPWTSRYMDWYVSYLHRWTDSRPNWRQLQRGTLGKSCAKVEATSDRQNVFLLERQRQAPFFIHGNHYACVHACICSGESACALCTCSSLPFHRGVQKYSPHTPGITYKTSWQCDFVDLIVNVLRRADICNQKYLLPPALMFILQKGLSASTGTKKVIHVNSKVTLTVNGNFCSSISRNEHERSFLSTRRDGLHSLTYIHYDGAEARVRRLGTPRHRHAKQLVAWWSQLSNSHVLPIHRGSDSRPTWREQANLARTSKQPLTSCGLLAQSSRARRPWAPFFNHSNLSEACPCACVWSSIWSWSAEQPRNFVHRWCPAPHKRAAVRETVYSANVCLGPLDTA